MLKILKCTAVEEIMQSYAFGNYEGFSIGCCLHTQEIDKPVKQELVCCSSWVFCLFSSHPLSSPTCLLAPVPTEALLADTPDLGLECQSAEHGLFQKWCLPSFGLIFLALPPVSIFALPPGSLSLILLRFCSYLGGHLGSLSTSCPCYHSELPAYELILLLEFQRPTRHSHHWCQHTD